MEHINLPVSVERTESMTDLIDAKGNTVIWQGSSFPEMDEIALALNEHDKLVAERDALVKACEMLLDWNDPLKSLPADIPPTCPTLPEVIKLAEAALALVRGEGDE